MPRKKKESRKYKPLNEFRFNHSQAANSHPHYIFGVKGIKYKSLPLTTTRPGNVSYYTLEKNPNPNDKSTAYLPFVKPHTAKITLYDKEVLKGWGFDKEDMPVIRHRIKKYKKSYNRKPPMWYEKKKQKKK